MLGILRAEQRKKCTRLNTRVRRCLAAAIQVTVDSEGGAQVLIASTVLGAAPHHLHVSRPVPLATFLQVADVLGKFDELLGPVARDLVYRFLAPAVAQGRRVDLVADTSSGGGSSGSAAGSGAGPGGSGGAGQHSKVRLALAFTRLGEATSVDGGRTSSGGGGSGKHDGAAADDNISDPDATVQGVRRVEVVLSELTKVFGVLHRYVLGGSSQFAGRLGRLVFASADGSASGGGLEDLLAAMLKSALPRSLEQMAAQRDTFAETLSQFLAALRAQGFVAASNVRGSNSSSSSSNLGGTPAASGSCAGVQLSVLESFGADLALHFVKAEREAMLRRARELIAKDAFNSCLVGGPDGGGGASAFHYSGATVNSDGRDWGETAMALPSGGEHILDPVFRRGAGDASGSSSGGDSGGGALPVRRRPVSFLAFPECHVTASTLHLVRLSEEVRTWDGWRGVVVKGLWCIWRSMAEQRVLWKAGSLSWCQKACHRHRLTVCRLCRR